MELGLHLTSNVYKTLMLQNIRQIARKTRKRRVFNHQNYDQINKYKLLHSVKKYDKALTSQKLDCQLLAHIIT